MISKTLRIENLSLQIRKIMYQLKENLNKTRVSRKIRLRQMAQF